MLMNSKLCLHLCARGRKIRCARRIGFLCIVTAIESFQGPFSSARIWCNAFISASALRKATQIYFDDSNQQFDLPQWIFFIRSHVVFGQSKYFQILLTHFT
ncbi:hypothetical protein K439DRAFT_20163 [Ramaria rubella]|nr:hypothetical protein K439DRAFT_20163 [Ramaria rubella]